MKLSGWNIVETEKKPTSLKSLWYTPETWTVRGDVPPEEEYGWEPKRPKGDGDQISKPDEWRSSFRKSLSFFRKVRTTETLEVRFEKPTLERLQWHLSPTETSYNNSWRQCYRPQWGHRLPARVVMTEDYVADEKTKGVSKRKRTRTERKEREGKWGTEGRIRKRKCKHKGWGRK